MTIAKVTTEAALVIWEPSWIGCIQMPRYFVDLTDETRVVDPDGLLTQVRREALAVSMVIFDEGWLSVNITP